MVIIHVIAQKAAPVKTFFNYFYGIKKRAADGCPLSVGVTV
jgi:hypothetical protein